MINLSPAQAKVVNAPMGGAMQVLASAGTGKTRVLTERVRFILENTKKDGVIALTFTNKAAEEMVNRLEDVPDVQVKMLGCNHPFRRPKNCRAVWKYNRFAIGPAYLRTRTR